MSRLRALIALGGNAMTGQGGDAAPAEQDRAIRFAMDRVADLVGEGVDVLLTHGNGPQVGNLLVKNELAAHVVPPVPLDWCGAQTQGTIGFLVLDALESALAARGLETRVAAVVTRTLVDGQDPGFGKPTKPIGRYLPEPQARALMDHGQVWEDRGSRGWRRVVASPEPLEILTPPPSPRWPRPATSCSGPAAAASRWCAAGTASCAASRRSSTRTSPPRCWRGRPTWTCWSSPPTSSTSCSAGGPTTS